MTRQLSPSAALRRFGLKQTLKGAIIVGVLAGLMATIQGLGYAAAYPTEKDRTQFAASLQGAPALGILYGDTKNLAEPDSYIVYRVVVFLGLIASIWGLSTVTRLLRGQEEDGKWELIEAGRISSRQATWHLILGFGYSVFIAFSIATIMLAIVGLSNNTLVTLAESAGIMAAIFVPSLFFGAIGVFVSQLSVTKRRAFIYGLVPLLILFSMRSVANTIPDLAWLKHWTPFGWSDLFSPVINTQPGWLLLFTPFVILFMVIGIYMTGKRDIQEGFLSESTTIRPNFALLNSPITFALRQNALGFAGWAAIAITISLLIANIANVAVQSITESPGLAGVINKIGGSTDDLHIAFIGTGLVFTAIVLLIMAAANMAAIRNDEARNYLDTILTQPISRSSWLVKRLLVITTAFCLVSLLSACITWFAADTKGIHFELWNFLLVSFALTGTAVFILGLGTFIYGFWPRFAATSMYAVIAWSFIIDAIDAVTTLDDWIAKTSLFHYVSLSPTSLPDWSTFLVLAGIGIAMAIIGIAAFTKRDIVSA